MAILRKLTAKLCDECIYMSGTKKNGCNYMALTGHSRIFKGRDKVVPDGYCNKFKKGKSITNFIRAWERADNVLLYSEKGGRIYDKGYHKLIDRYDSFDADS